MASRVVVAGAVVVAWLILWLPTAHAVFPGSNGKIAVITEYYDGPCDDCGPEGQRAWIMGHKRLTASLTALSIAFSPAGSRVAYQSVGGNVWVARADGSNRRLVSTVGGQLATLAWSPLGGTIAHSGGSAVVTVSATGKHKRVLAPSYAGDVAWDPTGSRLAFINGTRVEVVGADGQGLHVVFDDPQYSELSALDWSAAGWLSFKRRGRLVITRPGETEARVLLRGLSDQSDRPYFDYSWSPDGRQLAFVRPDGLWVTRVPDGPARRVSPQGGYLLQWSPDGRLIAYVRKRSIFTVAVRGGRTRLFGRVNDRRSRHEYVVDLDWQPQPR